MTELDLGPIGIGLDLSEDRSHLAQAVELERLGYSTLWLAGGQLKSLAPVADLVRATEKIKIGTGIVSLDVHDAAAVTRSYVDIEQTDPGRYVVGLGAPQQVRRPMETMSTFLDRLDGQDRTIPQHRRILAALGPKKLAMARNRFAGAIALLVTPTYTAEARGLLGADRLLIISQFMVLDTDAERARDAARQPLSFLMQVPGYRQNTLRLGFTEAEVDGLADRLVDALVSWGDADDLAARVDAHREAGADQVNISFLPTTGSGSFLDHAAELAHRVIH